MTKRFIPTLLILIVSLLLAGCNLTSLPFGPQTAPTVDEASQATRVSAAAQGTATQMAVEGDLARILTQTASAGEPKPADTETQEPEKSATATSTEKPTAAPSATPTLQPTATQTPVPPTATATATPVPTKTFTPSPTPIPCNAATFIKDVTVPDGSIYNPNVQFTKTWRLKNAGSCTWTTDYSIVFGKGDKMSAPDSVKLPADVTPGSEVDVSVKFTAPGSAGSYRSNWKLKDNKGNTFGVGKSSGYFYADIKVVNPTTNYPLDMVALMCNAEWTSSAGKLACPSPDNDSKGFVFRVDKPKLENGGVDDEPALLTNPQVITDGIIRGKYPAFHVENGYHFKSVIGCAYDAKKCDVKFELAYQIGDGAITTLQTWSQVYDGNFAKVDVDLSSLAGKDVKFILTVYANGESNGDRALWLAPRILKP